MTDPRIAPYVTSLTEPVFALRHLPEEVVAVLFAYYSRSPGSLRESLAKLVGGPEAELAGCLATPQDDDSLADARRQAQSFHEKWVVGYGHSSVAEHAVAHVAIEGCSILASKVVEDCRLASYTEKSTRYVWFEPDAFHTPAELDPHPTLKATYQDCCRSLMQAYVSLSETVTRQVRDRWPIAPGQAPRHWEAQTKAKACDLCRLLLPASSQTNLGMTLNARSAEHLIRKLLSHPLAETQALGVAIKREVTQLLPTLVKYADRNPHLAGRAAQVDQAIAQLGLRQSPETPPPADPATPSSARLVEWPEDAIPRLATAVLYERSSLSHAQAAAQVAALGPAGQLALIRAYLSGRGKHDAPGRALEHVTATVEVVCDYGAYRDIQRHRMCTQAEQPLATHEGFSLPDELAEMGHAPAYLAAMAQAQAAHALLQPAVGEVAAYAVPLAFRKRLLMRWTLREMWHFISLRSARQGHASYRRVAQDCWRALHAVCPPLAELVPVDLAEHALARAGTETVEAAS